MACKECVHFEMCNRTDMKDCPYFKDRSQFVEVVHGRWIPCENGGYYCSNCDTRVAFIIHNKFCPNCGAKMDGGDTL